MTSCYIIMEHATSTGNSVMQFMSRSRQPPFAVRKRQLQHRTQLTASRCSVTKTGGLSNTLRVQKGQMAENGYCDTYVRKFDRVLQICSHRNNVD